MTLGLSYSTDLEVKADKTAVDRLFFNRRFKAIMDALNDLDARVSSFGETESTLVQLGLDRLDQTLSPLLTTLQEAADLGFLVCQAVGTSASMTVGQHFDVNVTDGADLFTPTPYLLAIDNDDDTNWGVVSLVTWTKETGDLSTICVYASKTLASTSWSISANSALPAAMQDLLSQAVDARDDAVAAQASVASDIGDLQDLIDAVQSGPVASVAGKTGAVTLVESDIANLVSDLGAKATTAYVNSAVAGKQNQSAKLDALANLTWATNKLIYATSTSTLSTTDISDFIKTLLDDSSAATALTTLGVSSYIQTLLNDADASTAQTTLGISTFIKTLLDDADVGSAQTTLGVSSFIKTLLDDADAATARATLGVSASVAATDAQIRSATGSGYVQASSLESASAVVVLTDATTIAVDWDAFINAEVTLAGANHTLGAPTNGQVGTTRTILVKGNSTTLRALFFNGVYQGAPVNDPIDDVTSTQWYMLTIQCVTTTHFVVSKQLALGS